MDVWDAYKQGDKKIVKFVPASGAASRMFKNMFEFLGADYDVPTTDFEKKFFDHIHNFAFYNDLNAACMDNTGKNIDALLAEHNYKAVVSNLLEAAGLNYGSLPKGLLKFHRYADGVRTPLEEHLVEGALYAAGKSGEVNVHFTVSTEHRDLFQKLVDAKVGEYAAKYGIQYHISFSEQKPSTDTIAADMDNKPFRDKDGKLLFRPGGHGALIENLNDLDADIVFIKNIDNVVPDRLKADTVTYKKLLAGVLVTLQQQAFKYLELLDSGHYRHDELEEIIRFVQHDLRCRKSDIKNLEDGYLHICEVFPEYKVSKVHGKMKPAEKDEEMQRFLRNKTQIMVATTVIEVGVNVPNASVMVIENAERFGLSQLHQLRGRVGRGADQSYCILVTGYKLTEETRKRIEIMVQTNDGFEIAEADLKLRGPGDLEGTQQSGVAFDLKIADIARDGQLLQYVRDIAEALLDADPNGERPENAVVWKQLKELRKKNVHWAVIS